MAGVMEHCISHCMEIFYDFGGCLSAISVISQGNVWDLCTVLDVDLNE